ncbi:MAG: hypothetical protein DRQ88_05215 [Epsilonproteobacteria bacterium]|nr:MAG: hypothetical protein DRQ88_05215 [Campylobacterota bacterium]
MTLNCITHNKSRATGSCQICDKTFCSECLENYRGLLLCSGHHLLAQKSCWTSIKSVRLSSENPKKGLMLQEIKEKLWEEMSLPAYIITHYRLNLELDIIESHMDLYVRREDQNFFKEKLKDQA